MTTDINQRLAEIKERMEKATEGPWIQFIDKGYTLAVMPAMRPGDICQFGNGSASGDADFISHSIADVPFLLTEIERLQGERLELIKVGFTSCIDMGPPSKIKSNDGTHTTTWTWEEPDYEAVLATYLQSRQEISKDEW